LPVACKAVEGFEAGKKDSMKLRNAVPPGKESCGGMHRRFFCGEWV